MKRHILSVLTLVCTFFANASVAEADSAYAADDFLTAIRLYEESIDQYGPSAERYYNLGNAYYRAGANGMAIVNYERSLRLDPSNQDAKDNLEFVRTKIVDRRSADTSFVASATDRLSLSAHPDTWAWIAIVMFVLTLAGVCLYFAGSGVMVRKVGFFGGGCAALLCIVANVLACRSARIVTASDKAVVISPSVILSTTPRQPKDRTEEAMLLHEGTEVKIVDSISGDANGRVWYDVKVGDRSRAWIPSDAVEII